jgi:hypothetical protein
VKTTNVGIMDTNVKISISEHGFEVHNTKNKIPNKKYEPEVVVEDKVYLDTYYKHQPKSLVVNETPTKIKTHGLHVAGWTLTKDQQLMKFNLGTNAKPLMVEINA